MRICIRNILVMGLIILSLNKMVLTFTNVTSCNVTAGPAGENSYITVHVRYTGGPHKKTVLAFEDLLSVLDMVNPCISVITTTNLPTMTACTYSGEDYKYFMSYPTTEETITNITVDGFTFPSSGQSFPHNAVRANAYNGSSYGNMSVYCGTFSSPVASPELFSTYIYNIHVDLSLTMQNSTLTYQKTDISISFYLSTDMTASASEPVEFRFVFPIGALSASTICTV